MAELVIKISDELYDLVQNKLDFNGDLKEKDIKTLMLAIDDGVQLPKGHDKLIDAGKLFKELFVNEKGEVVPNRTVDNFYVQLNAETVKKAIIDAPAIVKANKTEREV